MDNAVNEALRALNTANLRRYADLQCPKARQRRLKAVQRLVRVLLGDPNVVCGTNVPFVNRPFESEIHGTVNYTQFCCVLLVTWCYRMLLSCYLRPK